MPLRNRLNHAPYIRNMATPLFVLTGSAVLIGALASICFIASIATDSWQLYRFDLAKLAKYQNNTATTNVRITKLAHDAQDYSKGEELTVQTINDTVQNVWKAYYLYDGYGGIWQKCDKLTDDARISLVQAAPDHYKQQQKCYVFVTQYNEDTSTFQTNAKQIARMQNSECSCFIVSMLTLLSTGVTGLLGVLYRNVSVCMVTGVLYVVAALFGVFALSIFHTKDDYERNQCFTLQTLPVEFCDSRTIDVQWAVPIAWIGVVLCTIACGLWLFLSRSLRIIKARTMV